MNVKHREGSTDFIYGYKNIEEFLLTVGTDTDMNVKNEEGNTVLMWAVDIEQKDEVELLLTNSADVNLRDKDGNTAFILAANNGHKDIVKLLKKNNYIRLIVYSVVFLVIVTLIVRMIMVSSF